MRAQSLQQMLSFAAVAKLSTLEERREHMLMRCQEIYETAQSRDRNTQSGKVSDPDSHAMVKCVELACKLLGVTAEVEQRIRRGEQDTTTVPVEQVAELLEAAGYEVKKRAA